MIYFLKLNNMEINNGKVIMKANWEYFVKLLLQMRVRVVCGR